MSVTPFEGFCVTGAVTLVLSFFLLTLVVGIIAGGKIRSLREYAVAGTEYSVPVLLFTILASGIGGGTTVGAVGEVYRDGVVVLLVSVGFAVENYIVSKFVAPHFDSRFKEMISLGDILEKFYGGKVESWAVFILCVDNVLIVGVQFIALGRILESLLGIEYNISIMISAFVVGIYSASGGVRAVIATDVMQLIAIVVVITIIAIIACMHAGGIEAIIPEAKIYSSSALRENLYSGLFYVLPIYLLSPMRIQRYLMAKSPEQLSEILNRTAIVLIIFGFIILIAGLSARKLIPGLDNIDNVFPELIVYLFKDDAILFGISAIAIISAVLSTSDSILNACSVLAAGKLKKMNDEINELVYVRVITVLFTIISVLFALTKVPILSTCIALHAISCIVMLAALFAIMRIDVAAKDFWVSLTLTAPTILLGQIFCTPRKLPIICAGVATIAFFTSHFIRNGYKFVWETRNGKRKTTSIDKIKNVTGVSAIWLIAKQIVRMIINILRFFRDLPKNVKLLFLRMLTAAGGRLKTEKAQMIGGRILLGMFLICSNALPCFILSGDVLGDTLNTDVYLRITTSLIALSLLYEPLWLHRKKKAINLWVSVITFCLPFSYVTQYMLEGGTQFNAVNVTIAFTIMSSLLNWASFLLFSSIGVAASILFCVNLGVDLSLMSDQGYTLVYVVLMSSIVGLMFFQYHDVATENKRGKVIEFATAVAHESKAPIFAMHSEASLTKTILEDFKREYNKTGRTNMRLIDMAIESAKRSIEIARITAQNIESLLSKCGQGPIDTTGKRRTIQLSKLVEDAVNTMGLSDKIRSKIILDLRRENDVVVNCDITETMKVIRSIIDNAIRYALSFKRGVRLTVRLEPGGVVEFEDNGPGIPAEKVGRVFEKFFTTSSCGTGLGLHYCSNVMEEMGGDIDCRSKEEEGTTLTLMFGGAVVETEEDETDMSDRK